jgi:ethanolamine ammonia-lyase small subunit
MEMKSHSGDSLLGGEWPDIVQRIRARTPARLLVGRVGGGYPTGTQMALRQAHAAARDAVRAELDLDQQLGSGFVKQWGLFEVSTAAGCKDEYLLKPHLGRTFAETAHRELLRRCTAQSNLQIAIGDGLSVSAVSAQVPKLLPVLYDTAKARGWSLGQVFVIRHCRVGILNAIGELLAPLVAVLLIGERPGLATAESLSAYMAYRPKRTQTDADRNLISNIHARGVSPEQAAVRIVNLAVEMMNFRTSGPRLTSKPPALEE